MQTAYHKPCKHAKKNHTTNPKTAFLEVQTPAYTRSYL